MRRGGGQSLQFSFIAYLSLDVLGTESMNFMSEGSGKEQGETVCTATS